MGEPQVALRAVMSMLRRNLSQAGVDYARTARVYTAGWDSLHKCYPGRGYEWMRTGSADARGYVYKALEERFGMKTSWWVDAYPLTSDKNKVPYGHLGFHEKNIALMLGDARNRVYWPELYASLWILLQTNEMLFWPSGCIHLVSVCRQGIHRSVVTFMVLTAILRRCGFGVEYVNACAWEQQKRRCQQGKSCELCGDVRNDIYSFDTSTNVRMLLDAAVDDFFDTTLAFEALVSGAQYEGMEG